jgi:hypothetical protein
MSIEQQLIDEIVFDNVIEESANKNQERLLSKKLWFLFLKWQQVKTPLKILLLALYNCLCVFFTFLPVIKRIKDHRH